MDEKLEPQEEEYQVEKVITHLLYEEAFELRGYIVFNPVTGGGEVHSKYVYLVKWLGYPDGDNTWEPEENLVDCTELLSIYKQSHGLPLYHETITRSFNWREPTTSLTQTEVNRRAFKNQERAISTPPLTRDPPPKKRKSKARTIMRLRLLLCISTLYIELTSWEGDMYVSFLQKLHSPIADIDDVDAEYCPTKRKKLVFWTSPGRPPKLVEDGKRKRGPKKGVTAGSAERKKPGRKPRALTSAVEVNKTKKADEEEQVEVIRYVLDTSSRRSRSPMRRLLDARRLADRKFEYNNGLLATILLPTSGLKEGCIDRLY
ncbi:unnamed protein product [Heligmosomoides polygyrus]|uniref:Chromo domain-containing protein n=1 Tax=Heligmosomoides polygyrus TaxID=6339 RepID=A0A183G6J5_HELPZ|nr:unnamed protein product [Heligmosomoides polygyrus]